MTKEQRFMTLTLLKLARSTHEAIGSFNAQSSLIDKFVTAICDINGLHYNDPISLRIFGIVITYACVEFQLKPYRTISCFKDIEKELAALERLPSLRKKRVVRG